VWQAKSIEYLGKEEAGHLHQPLDLTRRAHGSRLGSVRQG
jgi:hypothetical protein